MPDVTDQFRRRPEWGLVVGTARIERARRAIESHTRLNAADNRLLWLLTSEGPRTMREISESLGLEQSTVNRQVNAALDRGLVDRVEREGSAARAIRITAAGQELFSSTLDGGMVVLGKALDALPASQREGFVEQYLTFSQAYRVAADALGFPATDDVPAARP